MSSRGVIASALFLIVAAAAHPLDWRSFAASTDSGSDAILIDAFASGDTETRLAICAGIGLRPDPYDARIIEIVADGHRGNAAWEAEVFIRALLASVFDNAQGESQLRERIRVNAPALDLLFTRMSEWRDPQIVEALVDLAPLCPGMGRLGALMETGTRLARHLTDSRGMLDPQERSLALAFLRAAAAIGDVVFLSSCTEMARLSRDRVVVDQARAAARALLAPASFLIDSGDARTPQDLLHPGSRRLPS